MFQVLLSQCHRFRALLLLGRFLDMGPWAVDLVVIDGCTLCCVSFYAAVYVQSAFFFVGPFCWNISLCSEAVANNHTRIASDPCVHMDKDFGT